MDVPGLIPVRSLSMNKLMILFPSSATKRQCSLVILSAGILLLPHLSGYTIKLWVSAHMKLHCRGWIGGRAPQQGQWPLHLQRQMQRKTSWFD
jgi:hypothetical protein